jgi:hypothetical protein
MAKTKGPNPIDKHVGSRIRMRRMMLGMSQEKLATAFDVPSWNGDASLRACRRDGLAGRGSRAAGLHRSRTGFNRRPRSYQSSEVPCANANAERMQELKRLGSGAGVRCSGSPNCSDLGAFVVRDNSQPELIGSAVSAVIVAHHLEPDIGIRIGTNVAVATAHSVVRHQ